MTPQTIGADNLSREDLLSLVSEMAAEMEELRADLTATLDRQAAIRGIILSIAARWQPVREDLLRVAEIISDAVGAKR